MLGEFCIGAAEEPDELCRGAAESPRVCASAVFAVAGHHPGTNFACNSPQGISSYEIESLKFCRFRVVVYVGSAGIACDFAGRESFVVIPGLMAACDWRWRWPTSRHPVGRGAQTR